MYDSYKMNATTVSISYPKYCLLFEAIYISSQCMYFYILDYSCRYNCMYFIINK